MTLGQHPELLSQLGHNLIMLFTRCRLVTVQIVAREAMRFV
jgi:hypothetical protein